MILLLWGSSVSFSLWGGFHLQARTLHVSSDKPHLANAALVSSLRRPLLRDIMRRMFSWCCYSSSATVLAEPAQPWSPSRRAQEKDPHPSPLTLCLCKREPKIKKKNRPKSRASWGQCLLNNRFELCFIHQQASYEKNMMSPRGSD